MGLFSGLPNALGRQGRGEGSLRLPTGTNQGRFRPRSDDAAEQVKSELGDEAEFIHMEVFEDNNPTKGVREQLETYGLHTEPWLFVLDAEGRVSTRIEGAFSAAELRQAVEKATG